MSREFAFEVMQHDGISVSLEDDMIVVECKEYSEGVIDTGVVHTLSREHGLDVERVLVDFEAGAAVCHVVPEGGEV